MRVSLVKHQKVDLQKSSAIAHYHYRKPPLTPAEILRPTVWDHLRFPVLLVLPFAPAVLAWAVAGPNAGWFFLSIGIAVFAYCASLVINAAD